MNCDLCEKLEELAKTVILPPSNFYANQAWRDEQAALLRQAISLLRREGMVWVPEEPTHKMSDAGREVTDCYPYKPEPDGHKLGYLQIAVIYRAMLKAAKEN